MAEDLGWTLIERCAGGEFGAHLVERGAERAILKVPATAERFDAIAGSVELAERVRARGQLVPRYYDVGMRDGAVYVLQERVEGELPDVLTVAHATRMIDLLATHEGAAAGWGERAAGFTAWWDPLETLRAVGGLTAELGDEIGVVVAGRDSLMLPSDDVVHDDYHLRNVLLRDDKLVAIIDWEGACPGDRRFDAFLLSWWLRAAPDLTEPAAAAVVTTHAEDVLADRELAFYAAWMAMRVLDFYARERPETLGRWNADVVRVLAPYWRG